MRSKGQSLALKTIKNADYKPEYLKVFYQELSLMWRFRDHENFVKVFGFSKDPYCLIMKLYRHGDLMSFIKGKNELTSSFPYSLHRVIKLCKDMAQAITVMHQASFAHRDVKPSNFLLEIDARNELRAVISDFGISLIPADVIQVKAFEPANVDGLTTRYSSPEAFMRYRLNVAHGNDIIMAGDVFSLSLSMFHIVTRRKPWVSVAPSSRPTTRIDA
jgi:serine/threonine protein kinase